MNILDRHSVFTAAVALGLLSATASPQSRPKFRHVESKGEIEARQIFIDRAAENIKPIVDSTMLRVRSAGEILDSISIPADYPRYVNLLTAPWVFSGFHYLKPRTFSRDLPTVIKGMRIRNGNTPDSISIIRETPLAVTGTDSVAAAPFVEIIEEETEPLPVVTGDVTPLWLKRDVDNRQMQTDFIYSIMVSDPSTIEYAYWQLPDPPVLREDDLSFLSFINRMDLPEVDPDKAVIIEQEVGKVHWLHKINSGLQMSQAFLSSNWYQGGNNNFAFLMNFNWNVALNTVYHPNLIFTSNLSYKLGFYSNPKKSLRKFSISDDLFQYNLNAGLKALSNWFYSFNLVFKTQLLNNYEQNSDKRTASFLSPGELNMGLGMTYSRQNKLKTFKLSLAISPLSYNLKTCIDSRMDETQFKIKEGHRSISQIGSNCETTIDWNITSNINLKSRMFLFTDYDYFLGDWENTLSFAINKFLSTQIYAYLRYDSSAPAAAGWGHFMLKEILSFGLSYTFSTKP